ncbi:MAG: 5'(3')-deoxyribonucleotidase [Bacteroidota bacterium]
MSQKRLIVDMDGVLADVYAHFIQYEKEYTGLIKKKEDLIGVTEEAAFTQTKTYVRSVGFFRTLPVIPNSQEVLEALNTQYQVYIVSSAMEFPNSLREKYDWLAEYFPYIHWKQIVLCGDKRAIQGDIMIDDHFKNLDYFEEKTYLFSQPHNQASPAGRHERVDSWEELRGKLLVKAT